MRKSKINLTVIINVLDTDALRLSVPPLGRMSRLFNLVIYNDNQDTKIERRTIRRMGWHGGLHIINSDKNYGEFESRMAAVKSLRALKIPCDWVLFLDSGDVLLDAGVPNVTTDVFAIVQNATVLSDNITDIFKITPTWVNGCDIGKNGPHFEITGTLLRYSIFDEFVDFIDTILPKLYRDLRHTRYRVPIGKLLWLAFKVFMQIHHPGMSPIYMNRTNYVAIKMGHAPVKYGRRIPNSANANAAITDTMKRFLKTVEAAAKNVACEP